MSPARQAHSVAITAREHTVRQPGPNAVDVRVGAEIDAAREEALRAEEEARDMHRGLQVCAVRQLPGGGTAYVLR